MARHRNYPDLAEVRGQGAAKRALEVAAAGGHSLLMSGSAGCRQIHAGATLSRPVAGDGGRRSA